MTTVAYLDVQRPEMIEPALYHSRKSSEIQSDQHAHNLMLRWPKTGSWTLYPVNFSSDFVETAQWEACKLKLADFNYNPDYWTNVYEGARGDLGQYDPFMHCIVSASNVPDGFPFQNTEGGGLVQAGGGYILSNLTDVTNLGIQIAQQNLQSDNGVVGLVSKSPYPANMGWCLRFHVDGRESYARAALFDFLFGEYLLRINSTGVAELQITGDGVNYDQVLAFVWSDAQFVHGRHHAIMITPHARQHIEILSRIQYTSALDVVYDDVFGGGRSTTLYGGLFTLPGQPVPDPDTGLYPIVSPGPIALRVHREFRPYIQISRMCYYNGTANQAYLYDSPFSMEFPPSIGFQGNVDADVNGGAVQFGLVDPATHAAWVPGASTQAAFYVAMQGQGDVAGPGLASTTTPEYYAYAVDKPPLFRAADRGTFAALPQTTKIDFGDDPESETCNLTFDNSNNQQLQVNGHFVRAGQLEGFAQRGDIPLTVANATTGVVWFEGRSTRVESREYLPRALSIESSGLIESFLRRTWSLNRPNFGIDPQDPKMRGMFWGEAVYRMFEAGGFPRSDVVIENLENYNFRLWAESGGGSRGSAGSSAGHLPSGGNRFWPEPGKPIVESLNFLLKKFLGWTFSRDRRNGVWRVYKRPHPFVQAEYAALAPKVAFYANKATATTARDGIFSLWHDELKVETIKPAKSNIVVWNGLIETGFGSPTPDWSLPGWLNQVHNTINGDIGAITGQTPVDPSITQQDRQVVLDLRNEACYLPEFNPNPATGPGYGLNPDWLGEQRFGTLPTSLPNRECMEWWGRMAYYALCFGHEAATWLGDWGDPFTAYLRKWDLVILDTGPNYESEWWFIDRITPDITSDRNVRARYRATKLRSVCPPPY